MMHEYIFVDTIIHGSKLEEFDTVILSFAGAFDLVGICFSLHHNLELGQEGSVIHSSLLYAAY